MLVRGRRAASGLGDPRVDKSTPLVKQVYKIIWFCKPHLLRRSHPWLATRVRAPPAARSPRGSTETWCDKKRYLWLIGLVVPSLAFVAFGGYVATGWGLWFWVGPIVILGIVPAIDLLVGLDRNNPPDDVIEALEKDRYYRWVTYAFMPMQYVGFLGAMGVVSGWDVARVPRRPAAGDGRQARPGDLDRLHRRHRDQHRPRARPQEGVPRALVLPDRAGTDAYGHFYIEHNRGHHVRVATPEDPASSRLGESIYEFLPRTVGGSEVAWGLEKRRLRPTQESRGALTTTSSTPGRCPPCSGAR